MSTSNGNGRNGHADSVTDPVLDPILHSLPFEFTMSPEPGLTLLPVYRASDEHGHSPTYPFRDTPGLSNVLEDLLRRYPQFKSRGCLMRSIVHWGVKRLMDEGDAALGLSPEAFVTHLEQRMEGVDTLERLEGSIRKFETRLSKLAEVGDFAICFHELDDLAHTLDRAAISSAWHNRYWGMIRQSQTMERVAATLQEKGWCMDYWNRIGPEFM